MQCGTLTRNKVMNEVIHSPYISSSVDTGSMVVALSKGIALWCNTCTLLQDLLLHKFGSSAIPEMFIMPYNYHRNIWNVTYLIDIIISKWYKLLEKEVKLILNLKTCLMNICYFKKNTSVKCHVYLQIFILDDIIAGVINVNR
jgi:hypothetical protein